jgi:hypothetical protein
MNTVKTCSDGKTCTLDKGHAGPCVQQRPVRPVGNETQAGRTLLTRPPWRDWERVYEPEVWEGKRWR